jgi:hypothetical protein
MTSDSLNLVTSVSMNILKFWQIEAIKDFNISIPTAKHPSVNHPENP